MVHAPSNSQGVRRQRRRTAFAGLVEADETFIGGKEANRHDRKKKRVGRGAAGKEVVAGIKDRATGQVRARTVAKADTKTLRRFVTDNTGSTARVYTDEAAAYRGIKRTHRAVRHTEGEYVRGRIHTNGIGAFWAVMKRGSYDIYHKASPKHLDRYVAEFASRHNIQKMDSAARMQAVIERLVDRRLDYPSLIAANGLASGVRPMAL